MQGFGHRLVAIESLGDCRLRLTYQDGSLRDFDFAGDAATLGPRFERLNEPEFVARAKVINFGGGLAFSAEVDYCADFLWLEGTPVESAEPVTAVRR